MVKLSPLHRWETGIVSLGQAHKAQKGKEKFVFVNPLRVPN